MLLDLDTYQGQPVKLVRVHPRKLQLEGHLRLLMLWHTVHYADDLEMLLLDQMLADFNAQVEDGSAREVCCVACWLVKLTFGYECKYRWLHATGEPMPCPFILF